MKNNKKNNNKPDQFVTRLVLPAKTRKEGLTKLTRLSQETALKILKSYGGLRSVNCNGINFTNRSTVKLVINGSDAEPRVKRSRRAAKLKNSAFRKCKFDCHITNFMNHHKAGRTVGGTIENCDFTDAVFTGVLKYVMFKDCDFRRADFSKAQLQGVQFTNCNFRGTILPNKVSEKSTDYRNSLGNHNRNPFNWDRRNLERIKIDKNAHGMNPDRVRRKRVNTKKKKK